MAALNPGSVEYQALFGGAPEEFVSLSPSYREIQNSYLDPSVRTGLGMDRFDLVAAKAVGDLRNSSRVALRDLATSSAVDNFPSPLFAGLAKVMHSAPIGC